MAASFVIFFSLGLSLSSHSSTALLAAAQHIYKKCWWKKIRKKTAAVSERVGRWLCIVTLFISYMRLCGVISYTIRSLWYSHDESSSNWTSRRSSMQWMIDGYMTRLARIYATSIFFWVFDECNIHMWRFCNFVYFFQKQHNISLCFFLQLMLTFEFYL